MIEISPRSLLAAPDAFARSASRLGPATAATVSTAAVEGRAAGLPVGLGLARGSLKSGLAAALCVTATLRALLAAPPVLRAEDGPGLYLLTVGAGRCAASPFGPGKRPSPPSHPLPLGYLIDLLNPNAPLRLTAAVQAGLSLPIKALGAPLRSTAP